MLEEETQHFPRRIRPPRIRVGARGTAPRPSVSSPMNRPLFAHPSPGGIGVDGAAVGMSVGCLAALHRWPYPDCRGCRLGDHGVSVAWMDGRVLASVKDNRRDHAAALAIASRPLTHGGKGGRKIAGGPARKTGVHPHRSVEIGIRGSHIGRRSSTSRESGDVDAARVH